MPSKRSRNAEGSRDDASRPSVHASDPSRTGGMHDVRGALTDLAYNANSQRVNRRSQSPEARAGHSDSPHGKDAKKVAPHKQNLIARVVNNWFDRVMGAMKDGGLSNSNAEYASHRTKRDFIWNSIGSASWAFIFPVVTMVSTQLVGLEQAGMISMAFVVGILLMFLGNYGVRTYQISDMDDDHSFMDYQVNRWITCILMVLVGWAYCSIRGYASEMFTISMAVIFYKMVDALADVYEGRLQQEDKLYLAGISQTIRSLAALAAFSIFLFFTRSAIISCIAMAIAAAATFVAVTWPLTLMETPKSKGFSLPSLMRLFKVCTPLFIAIFMFNIIENMPKFAMEGVIPYDNQLYYNALYFPAQMILILAQLVYKPLLVRMAGVWQDSSKRLKFNLILVGIFLVILAISFLIWALMAWVGIPVMSFLYGVDFGPYRGLLYLMLITGGITAAIDFLYQVITIMRRQKDVTVLYIMTFAFSLFIPFLLVHYAELEGAILSYVILEAILFALLVWEYFRIRRDLSKGRADAGKMQTDETSVERPTFLPLLDPADAGIDDDATLEVVEEPKGLYSKPLPSEIRANRERREEVMRRRTGKDRTGKDSTGNDK